MSWSDEDEFQSLKLWYQKYGRYLILAAVSLSLIGIGWNFWQKIQQQRVSKASALYTQVMVDCEQRSAADCRRATEQLIQEHPNSPYASLAALVAAGKLVQDGGDLAEAANKLRLVVKRAPGHELRQIARIRLARLLIEQKQSKEALQLLNTVDAEGFGAEIIEVCGDAWMQLGDRNQAQQAYLEAQKLAAHRHGESSPLLKIKLRQF